MKLSLVIPGPVVPWGRPRPVKGGGFINPPKYQAYRNHVRARVQVHMLGVRGWSLDGPFRLHLRFFFHDLCVRDDDNCEKGIKDALKGVLWKDDCWPFFRGGISKDFVLDRKNPRVEIEVEVA